MSWDAQEAISSLQRTVRAKQDKQTLISNTAKKYNQGKEILVKLKKRRDSIEEEIRNLERKQEKRLKFYNSLKGQ